jgi:LPXTG-motif cell wall-anchored protein
MYVDTLCPALPATFERYPMKGHLRAVLIALVSLPIAFGPIRSLAAVTDASPSVSPSASPTPSASASPTWNGPAASPDAVTDRPHTNLTAVFDQIAVPVRDGYRVRVGVRNSGPLSISAPAGQSAATFRLLISWTGPVTSLGGCAYQPEIPPWLGRPSVAYFDCRSGPTLRVGQTYWESFVFPHLSYFTYPVLVVATGYADDPNAGDNQCNVVVRVASSGSGLPVTGTSPFGLAGVGFVLVVVGSAAVWSARRRRRIQAADPASAATVPEAPARR